MAHLSAARWQTEWGPWGTVYFDPDFGFYALRSAGRVELARLEFGGLQPVTKGKREKVLRVVKETFTSAPGPVPPT